MAEVIRMPLLSDTMKEGVIAEWHKKVGDKVNSDDVIADVETDKATMEVMPYVDGTLLYIGVEKGSAAPVNGIIAIVGKEGEDYKSLLEDGATSTPVQEEAAPEAPKEEKKVAAPKPGEAEVIRMPLLSDTMKEGKIIAWHKKVGDVVKSDDVLAEVETDKATMEVMPYVDGTILYIGVEEGNAAKVNEIIAIVGKPGTDIETYLAGDNSASTVDASEEAPKQASAAASTTSTTVTTSNTDDRIKASPLAKKLASEKGIDISKVTGTGDNGRVIKRDIENYTPSAVAPSATSSNAPAMATAVTGQEGYTDIPVSQMRGAIARRLGESKFNAPHFYLRITINMDNAMASRKSINEVSTHKVSFNDLVIKASAMALRQHPFVNSSWLGDTIRQNHHIHIGTAVAIDDGLIVPVVKFADQKSLSEIAKEAKELATKARDKKLQPPEFTGNTFTISNLGMMGIDEFTAIINPPDSCILAVGNIVPTPVVENGEIVVRNLMKLTLSCDHRVVDGAVGSKFLQTLKAFLENPVTMLA
ncbi:MAG: pyruvate dehydrogenase complex dihydrolipoamide acetyltransferase [Flavipsychrobacter sp.]